MKLLIAGSRSITHIDLSIYLPDNIDLIISGGSKGIDDFAEKYADKHRISKLILRPRYDLYRRNAPLIRNRKMLDICDKAIIFWDGKSNGTAYTINYANKIHKPIEIIQIHENIN